MKTFKRISAGVILLLLVLGSTYAQAASLLSNPKFQIIDSNGTPVAGGWVYTYETGTSTELATYTDSSEVAQNTNPIVLDSRGEADVYLLGTYRVVTYSGDPGDEGVLIWSQDNIVGATPGSTTVTGMPVGSVVPYAGASAPSGWLLADGSEISRTTYSDLFTAIGVAYGVGNGVDTFDIPDMRDRFPLAKGTTFSTLAATGGATTEALPDHLHSDSHIHTMGVHNHQWHDYNGSPDDSETWASNGSTQIDIDSSISRTFKGLMVGQGGSDIIFDEDGYTIDKDPGDTNSRSAANTGNPTTSPDLDIMPPYLVLNYIIKT